MAYIKTLVIVKYRLLVEYKNVFAMDSCDCPGLPAFLEHTFAMAAGQVKKN